MQICPVKLPERERLPSVIQVKNKIRLDHDECCNCCCCTTPQTKCYEYVQPEVPKSFAPIKTYCKSNIAMDDNTTYNLSYWGCPLVMTNPFQREGCLTVGDGAISDETTHKASYLGNWCFKPDSPMIPCRRQMLGKGPMQDLTTQKHDYTWKSIERRKSLEPQLNIYCPCAGMTGSCNIKYDKLMSSKDLDGVCCEEITSLSLCLCLSRNICFIAQPNNDSLFRMMDDTTYRLSYFDSGCHIPAKSFSPIKKYEKSNVPMDEFSTYRLSYWPNEPPVKEDLPWAQKRSYQVPVEPIDGCTTYKLSYWPHCEKPRPSIPLKENDNLLNADCCFEDNTTYGLSYFGCGGDRPEEIRPASNIELSSCPLSHDTVNKLSFLGNWCPEPEKPMIPCRRQLLGEGPMQNVTTQKHDYTWKRTTPEEPYQPEGNLVFSSLPLECCTTHRLSYIPNNQKSLLPAQSFAPIHKYMSSNIPLESETTMRLSYQPVESVPPVDKPWVNPIQYHPPVNPMEEDTVYKRSYIPPGTLIPLPPCSANCLSSNNCAGKSDSDL